MEKEMDLSLCVLISCMNEDESIIERSNVQSNVVVVNQCNTDSIKEYTFSNKYGRECKAKFISTRERGLSRSRNMAIKNSEDDICLICDDDEVLSDCYEMNILDAYINNSSVDIHTFAYHRTDKEVSFPHEPSKVGLKGIMQTSSIQVTFRKSIIKKYNIFFDEKMGSGTGNGGGEENKFLYDYYKRGAKIYYNPIYITTLNSGESQWFKGYSEEHFRSWGWSIRRIFGACLGSIYLLYVSVHHYNLYSSTMSFWNALRNLFHGFFESR